VWELPKRNHSPPNLYKTGRRTRCPARIRSIVPLLGIPSAETLLDNPPQQGVGPNISRESRDPVSRVFGNEFSRRRSRPDLTLELDPTGNGRTPLTIKANLTQAEGSLGNRRASRRSMAGSPALNIAKI
jgi:hypothetical protein